MKSKLMLMAFTLLLLIGCQSNNKNEKYVDLGLPSGNLWARCNVGAQQPYEQGDYFAWGEVSPKETYTWDNYKYSQGDSVMTKYNLYPRSQYFDMLDILEPCDDAAKVNMGKEWSMPMYQDVEELRESCEWEIVHNFKNTEATVIVGKSKFNGESITIPSVGIKVNDNLEGDSFYNYWSCEMFTDMTYMTDSGEIHMCKVYDTASDFGLGMKFRYYGLPVRGIIRTKAIEKPRDGDGYYDPVEDTPEYKKIIYAVEEEVADSMNKYKFQGLGVCFKYWDYKQKILKKYGIEWKSPDEMNPDTMYD